MAKEKTPPPKEPSFSRDDYNDVVRNTRLIDVMLVESKYRIKPEFFSKDRTKRKLVTAFEVVRTFKDKDFFVTITKHSATAKLGNKVTLKCEAEYHVVFEVAEDSNEEALNAFGRHMSQFIVYPYFRQHVAARSWESGADLPILPVIKRMPNQRQAENVPADSQVHD